MLYVLHSEIIFGGGDGVVVGVVVVVVVVGTDDDSTTKVEDWAMVGLMVEEDIVWDSDIDDIAGNDDESDILEYPVIIVLLEDVIVVTFRYFVIIVFDIREVILLA